MNRNITKSMLESAHKFVYLVRAYPEKTMDQVIQLFQMPQIDINCAIWVAIENGWLDTYEAEGDIPVRDPKTGQVLEIKRGPCIYGKVVENPEWAFGEVVDEIEHLLEYMFDNLTKKEDDVEENYLGAQMSGYSAHDTLIAVKHLLETEVMHEYEIEDGENAYIFYTLKANAGKNWGKKQFKSDPLKAAPRKKSGK